MEFSRLRHDTHCELTKTTPFGRLQLEVFTMVIDQDHPFWTVTVRGLYHGDLWVLQGGVRTRTIEIGGSNLLDTTVKDPFLTLSLCSF